MTTSFPIASGYGNFPNGVYAPEAFKKEALYYFRQMSTVDSITTSMDGFGITDIDTKIHIRLQPQVSVKPYTRGANLDLENITDTETTLEIDQGNYYFFQIDDLVEGQSDVDYMSLCAESAAYQVKDAYDREILSYMVSTVYSGNVVGASGSEKTIGYGSGNDYTPLDAIAYLGEKLDVMNVPQTGRFVVFNPAFATALARETGKLVEVQVTGDSESLIRNKGILDRDIHGFTLFKTNNLALNANSKPVLLAGHVGAVVTSQNFVKDETMVSPFQFGKWRRGLHVYGRNTVRTDSLALMHMNIGDV